MITETLCLFFALYFEARGEPIAGKIAVAEVIVNRVKSKKWPDSICEVVKQYKQFSFYWDGKPEVIDYSEEQAITEIQYVVQLALDDELPGITDGATHYHSTRILPQWTRKMKLSGIYGEHVFWVDKF